MQTDHRTQILAVKKLGIILRKYSLSTKTLRLYLFDGFLFIRNTFTPILFSGSLDPCYKFK